MLQFIYYLLLSTGINLHIDYPLWKAISQTEQLGALSSVCVYSILSLKLKQTVPGWLNKLLLSYAFLWAVWLAYTLADIFYFDYQLHLRDYLPVYLLVALLTYWIGIMAYLQPVGVVTETGNKTYGEMSQQEIDKHLSRLREIMEREHIYLDPGINLKQVAKITGMAPNLISFLVNNKLDSSFNEWLNMFRIAAVKKQMGSARLKELTIAGIAMECGFNSKATFNRVFKQQTGITPSDYLASLSTKK